MFNNQHERGYVMMLSKKTKKKIDFHFKSLQRLTLTPNLRATIFAVSKYKDISTYITTLWALDMILNLSSSLSFYVFPIWNGKWHLREWLRKVCCLSKHLQGWKHGFRSESLLRSCTPQCTNINLWHLHSTSLGFVHYRMQENLHIETTMEWVPTAEPYTMVDAPS